MNPHDNLVLWNRVYAEHNDARTATDAGLFMVSVPFEYAGFRTAVPVGPTSAASVAAARHFFASDPPAFVIFARPGVDDLIGDGIVELFQPPQMVCRDRVDERVPRGGAEVRIAENADDLHGYAVVAGTAFADLNFPAEQVTASLDRRSMLDDPRIAVAVAVVDGRIAAGAMSVTEGDGCYVSYVAADADARRHGLGDAVTRAVTNAGFDKGATFASLEASPFGYGVYERMGYVETARYALLVALPPKQ